MYNMVKYNINILYIWFNVFKYNNHFVYFNVNIHFFFKPITELRSWYITLIILLHQLILFPESYKNQYSLLLANEGTMYFQYCHILLSR